MKMYTIEEDKYEELEEWVERIVACGEKLLNKLQHSEFAMKSRDEFENDDYDWKIKKGNRYRY